jgi:hypothetical protein
MTNSSYAKYRIETDAPQNIYKIEVNAKGYDIDDPTITHETG